MYYDVCCDGTYLVCFRKKVKVQIEEKKETITQIGIGASLAFLIMMFNVPVPGGTTAHAVGSALLAILLGPWAACLAVTLALVVQAFLFGDGEFYVLVLMPLTWRLFYRLLVMAYFYFVRSFLKNQAIKLGLLPVVILVLFAQLYVVVLN